MTPFRLLLAAALLALPAAASAVEHEIRMLNKGADGAMVFEPGFLRVAPGDTVRFIGQDKGHNAETIPGLIPEGATPFKGKLNQDIAVIFDQPGLYGVKCLPHLPMGMVAMIQVGPAPANLEAVRAAKLPKKAQERLEAALSQVE